MAISDFVYSSVEGNLGCVVKLNNVPPEFTYIQKENLTLFGNRVFSDIIS